MKRKNTSSIWLLLVILLPIITLTACLKSVDLDHSWRRNYNLCKTLNGKVLVYPVFVEEKKGVTWSKEDKLAYMDSVKVATNWITEQATKNGVTVSFENIAHPRNSVSGLPGKSIKGTYAQIETGLGVSKINKHYDNICKKEYRNIPKTKLAKPPYISRIKTKDQFVSILRNRYQVENVVLMFVHKPEKKVNLIFSVNTLSNEDIEYSVNTFDLPNLIAEQILEMFGASVLRYDFKKKKQAKADAIVEENFPNDIMVKPLQEIRKSNIGSLTQYLIGWRSDFDPEHQILLEGDKIKVKR